MDISTCIPIVSWKITKKLAHNISDLSIPGWLAHFGFSHRFKLNTDSLSMLDKDKQLLYSLIKRFLFIHEITRPDVHTYVSYIITSTDFPTIYHKDGHLNYLWRRYGCLYCHLQKTNVHIWNHCFLNILNKYLLNIIQQIIQSQRFKKISTTLKRVLKNMIKWFDSNAPINLFKCITHNQEHTNNDTGKEKEKLINQEVKTTNNQYYITHQKLILSYTVTKSDIYNNYSYTSSVN